MFLRCVVVVVVAFVVSTRGRGRDDDVPGVEVVEVADDGDDGGGERHAEGLAPEVLHHELLVRGAEPESRRELPELLQAASGVPHQHRCSLCRHVQKSSFYHRLPKLWLLLLFCCYTAS